MLHTPANFKEAYALACDTGLLLDRCAGSSRLKTSRWSRDHSMGGTAAMDTRRTCMCGEKQTSCAVRLHMC